MRHCDWENADFPAGEFMPYRGLIFLHVGVEPEHLTNGQLRDFSAFVGGDVPSAVADAAGAAVAGPDAPQENG